MSRSGPGAHFGATQQTAPPSGRWPRSAPDIDHSRRIDRRAAEQSRSSVDERSSGEPALHVARETIAKMVRIDLRYAAPVVICAVGRRIHPAAGRIQSPTDAGATVRPQQRGGYGTHFPHRPSALGGCPTPTGSVVTRFRLSVRWTRGPASLGRNDTRRPLISPWMHSLTAPRPSPSPIARRC